MHYKVFTSIKDAEDFIDACNQALDIKAMGASSYSFIRETKAGKLIVPVDDRCSELLKTGAQSEAAVKALGFLEEKLPF